MTDYLHVNEEKTAEQNLEDVVSFLTHVPAWYLATIDANDPEQPRVRPFSFAAAAEGKLWFCTSRDKDVWADLAAHPKFELSGWKPGTCWIQLSGEAELACDDCVPEAVRQAGFEHMVGLGEAHESAHDGHLAFVIVTRGVARFCDIDGDERRVVLSA